jgi:hypothetical protein
MKEEISGKVAAENATAVLQDRAAAAPEVRVCCAENNFTLIGLSPENELTPCVPRKRRRIGRVLTSGSRVKEHCSHWQSDA